MIEIPEKPDRPVCSRHGPLRWGWFEDTKQGPRWVSFLTEDGGVLVPHVCDTPDAPAARWQPDAGVAARATRNANRIRQAMGWPTGEQKIITEKESA